MCSLGNSVSATLSAREDESAIHGGTDWEVFEWAHFNMFISTWTLLVAGLVFALPMIHLRVKNHTELADETLCVNTTTLLAL